MAFERDQVIIRRGRAADIPVDEGLRAYMLKIYNYMGLALGVTGAVALFVASSETMIQTIYGTPLQWVVMLAPLAFVMVLSFGINRLSIPQSSLRIGVSCIALHRPKWHSSPQ